MNIESDFRDKAKNLKSPVSRSFDASAWQEALASSLEIKNTDIRLAHSALWLNKQFKALDLSMPLERLASLGKEKASLLAFASINRGFIELTEKMKGIFQAAGEAKALSIDYILNQPMHGANDGRKLSIDDLNENMIDAADSWLFDASEFNEEGNQIEDLTSVAASSFFKYNIQHGMNDIWSAILWEGWFIQEKETEITFSPFDYDAAVLDRAWHARHVANFMNHPWLLISAWPNLDLKQRQRLADYRTVIGIDITGPRRRPRIGRLSCRSKSIPNFLASKYAVESSYLNIFMTTHLPKNQRLNGWILLRSWCVLADFASHLMKSLSLNQPINHRNIEKFALTASKSELQQILTKAVSIDLNTANEIIDFFTYIPGKIASKNQKGLWSTPLMKVGYRKIYALCGSVLQTSNTIRKIELWFARGGIDDAFLEKSKGDLYENNLRRTIYQYVTTNEKLNNSNVLSHAIKKDKKFKEQIDLIFKLNSSVYVCEIKCFVFPADSHSKSNLRKKLKKAAEQALKKCAAASADRKYIQSLLNLSDSAINECRFIPLVVVNHGFGTGLEFDGCVITDATFLSTFLNGSDVITSSVTTPDGGRSIMNSVSYYATEADAENNFLKFARNPPVLTDYIKRIYWERSDFPSIENKKFRLEKTAIHDVDPVLAMEAHLLSLRHK